MFDYNYDQPDLNPSICQICGLVVEDIGAHWLLANFDDDAHPEGVEEDEEALEARLKWFSDLRLLCDPDDEFGHLLPDFAYEEMSDESVRQNDPNIPPPRPRSQASDIEIHSATHWQGPNFRLQGPETGCPRYVTMFWGHDETDDERVYVVTHAACLEIALKVFASSSGIAHVRDVRGLFTALRWRQGMARKSVNTYQTNTAARPKVNYTLADHNYYMPGCNWAFEECPGMERPGPYDSARANLFHTLARHPLEIEDLTSCLLRNLQPCRSQVIFSAGSAKMAEGLARMPPEILDLIFFEMGRDLPRTSTRLISQKHWKDQLKAGSQGLLAWPWDIDADLVDQKDAERCPEGFEWDWELLVRQLTRGVDYGIRHGKDSEQDGNPDDQDEEHRWIRNTVGTGYHTDLAHVPAGLHNRRRIWQLVEEMFVGDAVPEPELVCLMDGGPRRYRCDLKEQRVLLWWDKSGALLPLPIWIPCINVFWPASQDGWHVGPRECWHAGKELQGATVEEVYAVLRILGYPV
ncbi:hypothetical protein CSOJ01_07993 [Colletotrichum sojae]|uniref:Uncharacterized protein n=1 Tax=Colletotrichum sojae TaxID=2175907 RepID=A0A8H6J7S7_9PEZI|nr:hypothetical protein CSOJ01_07993 [Colletotrichum sojae]